MQKRAPEHNLFDIAIILFLSGLYRLLGITQAHPFWVDEFSSAHEAKLLMKYGLGVFSNPNIYFESNNIITHVLVAVSFAVFGFHEWAARLPFAIIGTLVPACVYIVAFTLTNRWTALSAALFSACSYFLITWSRQARGYVLLSVLILLALYVYQRFVETENRRLLIPLVIIFLLGTVTHSSFVILIGSVIVHYAFRHRKRFIRILKHPVLYIVLGIFLLILAGTGLLQVSQQAVKDGFLSGNNLWYYHALLWREYGLITSLGILGMFVYIAKEKRGEVFAIFSILYFVFFCYFFRPYSSRYILPLFPLLFIFASYALSQIVNAFTKKQWTVIIITLFIIANGFKFVLKPKPRFYSVNHDFRDIALVDYDHVYGIIKSKGRLSEHKTAVIDTWWDRLHWYLGEDFQPAYAFRWTDEPGLINGLPKHTPYIMKKGEKVIPKTGEVKLISSLTDLQKVMKKYPRGFIYIDDESMPHDVIEYAKQHLKKELYLDHYPLDDNPYSIWPATLYSWGT